MKRIIRPALSVRAQRFLSKRTARVKKASISKRAGLAAELWRVRKNKTFAEIGLLLKSCASGRERCMYCEDNNGNDIDHYWPKRSYPELTFDWANYLWACSICNSNYKRDRFPMSRGLPLLLDPTRDEPLDHLSFIPDTGKFIATTSRGKASVEVFGLDRQNLETGRRDEWELLQILLARYASARGRRSKSEAAKLERLVKGRSFGSVLTFMIYMSKASNAHRFMHADTIEAIKGFPEIGGW